MNSKLRVVELFAGVGGFRIGLEGYNSKSSLSNFKKTKHFNFKVVFSNQWEPNFKNQFASSVYKNRWDDTNHSNQDINELIKELPNSIPDHDVLVGGFPCQDYSVAAQLNKSKGISGEKGSLWWSIYDIIKHKKPKYLILENVGNIINSPKADKGKDFSLILKSLDEQGYSVEWKVINAADYGMPQKRKRIFIVAYLNGSTVQNKIRNKNLIKLFSSQGLISGKFNCSESSIKIKEGALEETLNYQIKKKFNNLKKSPFLDTGFMSNSIFFTSKTKPKYDGPKMIIRDLLDNDSNETSKFLFKIKKLEKNIEVKFSNGKKVNLETNLDKLKFYKSSKEIIKINKEGFKYNYREGNIKFPDSLEKPGRTIITSSGSEAVSRSLHIIKDNDKLRMLTPVEFERLNMFPENHTKIDNISNFRRVFLMGNALVVGIVELLGDSLSSLANSNESK